MEIKENITSKEELELRSEWKKETIRFLVLSLIYCAAFWVVKGKEMTFEVYSNNTLWFTEDFSAQGKAIISLLVGIFGSICTLFVLTTIKRARSNKTMEEQPIQPPRD